MDDYKAKLAELLEVAESHLLGKREVIKQVVCCLLADGHLLIEDHPGLGKTTLVKVISKLFGLSSSRIQFTNDLLPADILGVSIYEQDQGEFTFHPGPIFSQLVLADEINRASPRTQSACLEAMEERQVTVDGQTFILPRPFFIVATQNPRDQIGSYDLPQSQLDRFLMVLSIGYPAREDEKKILLRTRKEQDLSELSPIIDTKLLVELQLKVEEVRVSPEILDKFINILERSRSIATGLSVRAGIRYLHASKAWAFLNGRNFVIPEDIVAMSYPLLMHRFWESSRDEAKALVDKVINIDW
ncbi:MAG: AAA family ATPase [Oligoflexales bacterium]